MYHSKSNAEPTIGIICADDSRCIQIFFAILPYGDQEVLVSKNNGSLFWNIRNSEFVSFLNFIIKIMTYILLQLRTELTVIQPQCEPVSTTFSLVGFLIFGTYSAVGGVSLKPIA